MTDHVVIQMRRAIGCRCARLLVDTDDQNAFTLESEWQEVDEADQFFASRDFQIFKGIRFLLRDEPVIVLDEVQKRTRRVIQAQ